MTNINLPPFYVGQKVRCIKDTKHYRKGEIYIIKEVQKCLGCGIWIVGCIKHDIDATVHFHPGCGSSLNPTIYWTALAKHFVSIENKEFEPVTYSKVIESISISIN